MSQSSDSVVSLTSALQQLQLHHQRELQTLLQRHQQEIKSFVVDSSVHSSATPVASPLPTPIPASIVTSPSVPPSASVPRVSSTSASVLCRDGYPISLGSTVRLLTNARTGNIGDTAVVIRTPSSSPTSFIFLRLVNSSATTTRRATNLSCL